MAPRTKNMGEFPRDTDNDRPTVADLQGDNPFAQLAKKHWLHQTKKTDIKVKVKPEVLKKEIWDVLEHEDFPYRVLLILENLQILERQVLPLKYIILY
jgi:intron-binding protein aquarius